MTSIALSKHHGLGNDFLVAIDPSVTPTSADAVRWCDRHRGIGADGLIIATPAAADAEAEWAMVLYNADGSRAEISGNGIRCLGQALADHKGQAACTILVECDAGLRTLEVGAPDGDSRQVRVDMGAAADGPGDFDGWASTGVTPIRQSSIDMGNPHLVALVDDPAGVDLAVVGPAVESNYPLGLNVHFVSVDRPDNITLFVWERGAGITDACGSGACAAAVAASRWDLTDGPVTVTMPGGAAVVEVVGEQGAAENVYLTGPATFIADVVVGHG